MASCRQLSKLDLRSTIVHLNGLFSPQKTTNTISLTQHSTWSVHNRGYFSGSTASPTKQPLIRSQHKPCTENAFLCRSHLRVTPSVRSFLARYTSSSSSSASFLDLPVVKRPLIRYNPPGLPPPGQKHQTLTLYTITAIPEDELVDLRDAIFLRLVEYDITGRIYLAKDGINIHLCAPVQHVEALQSSLRDLVLDRFGHGPDGAIWNFSTEAPGERVFEKLKVMVKKQLVADGRLGQWSVTDAESPQYLEPSEFHARLDQVGDKALLIDMRNHFEK